MNTAFSKIGSPSIHLQHTFALHVIDFVFNNLAGWRDEESKMNGQDISTTAEEALTHDFHDYLEEQSHEQSELFYFHLEERQTGTRRIDLAAKPYRGLRAKLYGSGERRAITVFEAKRLPTPGTNRQHEYVTGYSTISGGIQRFKTCDHGSEHELAAMIGYIQKHDPIHFYEFINSCINNLSLDTADPLKWTKEDLLDPLLQNKKEHTARTTSKHTRKDNTPITLHHLWVVLGRNHA